MPYHIISYSEYHTLYTHLPEVLDDRFEPFGPDLEKRRALSNHFADHEGL